jgi:hypothetical protein
MSALGVDATVHERAPVAILDRHAEREAMIEEIQLLPRRADVTLTLDDGSPATACVEPDDLVWLDLRVGDIVWVAALPALPRCDASATVLPLSA